VAPNEAEIEAARRLLEVAPEDPLGLRFQAGVEFDRDRPEEALALLDRAAVADRSAADTYLLRARVHRRLGDDLEALRDLTTTEFLVPERADALEALGRLYFDLGAHPLARNRLERSLAADPENIDVLLYLGLCLGELGELEKAVETIGRVLEQEGDNIDARFNRAVLLARDRRYPEAADDLRRLLELDPEFPNARALLNELEKH
jgi:tetratricopeptide (TPR) repeat protein